MHNNIPVVSVFWRVYGEMDNLWPYPRSSPAHRYSCDITVLDETADKG